MALLGLFGGGNDTKATQTNAQTAANYAPALGGFIRGNAAQTAGGPAVVLTNVRAGSGRVANTGAVGKRGKVAIAPTAVDGSVNVTAVNQTLAPEVVNSALAFAENFGAQSTALSALAIQQAGQQATNSQVLAAMQNSQTQAYSASAIAAAQQQSAQIAGTAQQQSADIATAATTDPRNVTTLNASGSGAAITNTSLSIEKVGLVVSIVWFLWYVSKEG